MKFRVFLVMIVLFTLVGCTVKAPNVDTEIQAVKEDEQKAVPVKADVPIDTIVERSPDIQLVMDEIRAAIERGYEFENGEVFTRKGEYVLMGNPTSMIFNIGKYGDKGYMVQTSNGEFVKAFENVVSDWVGIHLNTLMGQLDAYSSNALYVENEFHQWAVKDVEIITNGTTHVVKVSTQLSTKKDEEHSVEIYTIVDGLLENYQVTSKYINSGVTQTSTFDYVSKGPIEGSELEELYNAVVEFLN